MSNINIRNFSLILFFTLYGLIYTEISNKKIPQRFSVLVILTSLLSLSLILINDLPYKVALFLISLLFILRIIIETKKYYIKKALVSKNGKFHFIG